MEKFYKFLIILIIVIIGNTINYIYNLDSFLVGYLTGVLLCVSIYLYDLIIKIDKKGVK